MREAVYIGSQRSECGWHPQAPTGILAAPMAFVLIGLALAAAVLVPQLWTRSVMARYQARPADRTGAEAARSLLDRLGLVHVRVESVAAGLDHYDPTAKAVRLGANHYDGRTLTAVVVAAHEVGHAVQDGMGSELLAARTALVRSAARAERVGAAVLLLSPLLAALLRAPSSGLITGAAALLLVGFGAVVHLVTLPVELDASFRQALPVLRTTGLIPPEDQAAAREILRAAAFTYLAASLAGLLNVWRWLRVLRRG